MSDHELMIRGERFACTDAGLSAWLLMKLAKASSSGDDLAATAGMYDFVMGVIRPEEHARFDAFMTATPVAFQELNEALGTLIVSYAGRPTDRPSPSPDGQPPTGQGSRVVSLSKPAALQRQSSTDGTQAAS